VHALCRYDDREVELFPPSLVEEIFSACRNVGVTCVLMCPLKIRVFMKTACAPLRLAGGHRAHRTVRLRRQPRRNTGNIVSIWGGGN
jgi:hypothetical protein